MVGYYGANMIPQTCYLCTRVHPCELRCKVPLCENCNRAFPPVAAKVRIVSSLKVTYRST